MCVCVCFAVGLFTACCILMDALLSLQARALGLDVGGVDVATKKARNAPCCGASVMQRNKASKNKIFCTCSVLIALKDTGKENVWGDSKNKQIHKEESRERGKNEEKKANSLQKKSPDGAVSHSSRNYLRPHLSLLVLQQAFVVVFFRPKTPMQPAAWRSASYPDW